MSLIDMTDNPAKKTEILVHTCCAPCLTYTAEVLKDEGFKITVYWYNPNIHGPREYEKRKMALGYYLNLNKNIDYITDIYNIKDWFAGVKDYGKDSRCSHCYRTRLEKTAQKAVEKGIESFTTTLLYSKFQNHELIKKIGKEIAAKNDLKFYYRDFRKGWKKGIEISKKMGLYRQEYCGCIFSAKERYSVI